MSVYNDVNDSAVSNVKNTGANSSHIEGKLKLPLISNGFEFDDVAAFKTMAALSPQIQAKAIVPLFQAYISLSPSLAPDMKTYLTEKMPKLEQKIFYYRECRIDL